MVCAIEVIPSQQSLNTWQQKGLNLIARLQGGRDVVIAIDLTESVGLNQGTQIRLRQIVEESLRPNDSVYIVPFAAQVNPLQPDNSALDESQSIIFRGKPEDIPAILEKIPSQTDLNLSNTDIQKAELYIYQGLAQINQCRLQDNRPLKSQSIIWVTDAPLLTPAGIDSNTWIETPGDSPFRQQQSPESQQRQAWLDTLPLTKRSLSLESYQLTVVDIPATVQEFCTPTPGGKETCLVNSYIWQQLWFPITLFVVTLLTVLVGGGFAIKYWLTLQKKWRLKITFYRYGEEETQYLFLGNQQKISIGSDQFNSISCPGEEARGHLERRKNQLFLIPYNQDPLIYKGEAINRKQIIDSNRFTLNCPYQQQDFEITISIER